MKKLLICIFCIVMLQACGNEKEASPVNSTNKNRLKENIQKIQSISMIGQSGAGNEHGYYYVNCDYENEFRANIKYIDYESKKEIYLCNQPNCKHDNEKCTSYLPIGISGMIQLYLDKEHLFILCPFELPNEIEGNDESFSYEIDLQYKMYMMNLDGSNRKLTGEFAENEDIQSNCFSQANYLYVNVEETMDNQSIKNTLVRMDGNTGKIESLKDMDDCIIIGSYKNQLVLIKSDYYAMNFTSETSVSDMQRAIAASDGEVLLYNVETGKETSLLTKPLSEIQLINVVNGALYYSKDDNLYKIEIASKKESVLYEGLKGASINVLDDTHLKLEYFEDKPENPEFIGADLLDLTNGEITPLSIVISSPRMYVDVLAETEDKFLVISGYDAEDEYIAYFNVTQTNIKDEYLSLIDKKDYYKQQLNFIEIDRGEH